VAIAAIFEYPAPPDGSVWQQRRDSYDHMNRELGGGQAAKTASDMADGLLVHFVGEAQDGRGIIVNVFESQEAMDRMLERMTQIRQKMEEPQAPGLRVEILTLHNFLT
jgi:hypothetical protein